MVSQSGGRGEESTECVQLRVDEAPQTRGRPHPVGETWRATTDGWRDGERSLLMTGGVK